MKKLFALLFIITSIFVLFACSDKSDGSDSADKNETAAKTAVQIVFNGDIDPDIWNDLYTAVFYEFESSPKLVDDSAPEADKEIVIGRTNRDISTTAYRALNRVTKEEDSHVAYVIYADGGSVAMAYDEDKYGLDAALLADVNYFVDTMVSDYKNGKIQSGILYKGSFDPISYQEELDQKKRDEEWMLLESNAGKDVVEATKAYYAMYSDNLISWMADLYDPQTGAFYFSNSGRNTEGYLPDIEATYDILSMIENSGMVDHLGGKYSDMPDWFLEKMGRWVKGLQHTNGYFYHPQWGKELTDTKPNRRSRDLSYGSAIMAAAGISPTYNTPSGLNGDFTLNDGTRVDANGNPITDFSLTSSLSVGVAMAVSKVVPTNSAYVADYLKDASSFRTYIYSLDLKNDSYVVGNRLSNQVAEIKQRDKELGGVLVPILESWLIEFQNPDNGTWDWTSESDPAYSEYDGVNGVLKLLTLFNGLGIEYPNPIPAANTIIKAIYADETKSNSVCHAYNTWFALEDLFENLVEHSTNLTETTSVINEIRDSLRANAVELINLTAKKVAQFIKPDSSSSFARHESSATSQGMRVCVPHTDEGDTNATLINTFGTLNHMFRVLGWSKPRMFGKADFYQFIERIENIGNVIKDPEPDPVPFDFEDDMVGATPGSVSLEKCNSTAPKVVIQDPTGSNKGNVFKYESDTTGHDSLYIPCTSANLTASCYIFESDLYFSTENEGYFSRIYIDTSYTIGLLIYDGIIHFIDATSLTTNRLEQDLGFTAKLEEWFNLRIEYYSGDTETVRMKIYLNGECVAVSNSFNDEGYGVPRPFYAQAKIEAFTGATMTVLMDNVLAYKSNAVYKEVNDPDGNLLVNVDHADREEILYDLEDVDAGVSLPDGWIKNDTTTATVISGADNKALNVKGTEFNVSIPLNRRTKDANAVVFSGDITVNAADANSALQFYFYDSGIMNTGILRLRLVPTIVDGETVMMMYEASGGLKGAPILGTEMKFGQKYNITIAYYEDKDAALVYIDGELKGFSSADEAYANRAYTGRIALSSIDGNVDITLDNVKVEKIVSSFDYSVKPSVDSIKHGFEQGIPEGGAISGATIADGEGANKVVSFSNGGKLTIPINKRSVATDTVILNAEILIPADASDGDSFNISFVSGDGTVMIKYVIIVKGAYAEMFEVTENNTYNYPIASFDTGNKVSIVIEYYVGRGVAQISFGDVCVAVTSITYKRDIKELDAAYVVLESTNDGANITVDNVVFETYNKFFVYKTAISANAENNAETITFEQSTTGNLPKYFSSDLRTATAAVRIEEMLKKAKASKVLAFETSAGANDKLYFTATSAASTRVATIFETNMYLDYVNDSTFYEIYLTNKSAKHSYLMRIYLTDGKLTVDDLTGASSALVPGRVIGPAKSVNVGEDEWFNLRIEYYQGDHNTVRIRTYINNVLVYVSCGYYGRSTTVYGTTPVNDIDRVMISSYGAVVGTMYLDDMSLTYKNIVPADAPLTYVPKEAEPVVPNEEDDAEILTFEASETGKLPKPITKEFSSTDPSLSVKTLVRNGKTTKVMSLNTTSGGIDKLYIAKTKATSGYNAIVFTTKIAFSDIQSSSAPLYIYFRNSSNTVLNRIILDVDANGNVVFNDYYNGGITVNNSTNGITGISATEWNDFRLTVYSYNGSCRIRIDFGDFSIVSTNPTWDSLMPKDIASLRIDAAAGTHASIMFDDLSLAEAIIEIPKEHEHTYSDEWTSDAENHWRVATCSDNVSCSTAVADKEAHQYGENGLCICGVQKHEHTYSDKWTYNETEHWHKATCSHDSSCSTAVTGRTDHSFNDDGKCECGYEKPKQKTELGYFDALGGYNYDGITGGAPVYNTFVKTDLIDRIGVDSCDVTFTSNPTTNHLSLVSVSDVNTVFEIGRANTHYDQGAAIKSMGGTGDFLVFETDIYISNLSTLNFNIGFGYTSDAATKATMLDYGKYTVTYKETGFDLFGTTVLPETWVNICIELNTADGLIKYYVNGVNTKTATLGKAPEISHVFFYIPGANTRNSYIRLDDTYFGFVSKHLTESDEYYTFNDGNIPSSITKYFKGGTSELKVTDAPYLNTTEKALTLISRKSNYRSIVYLKANEMLDATKVVFETKIFVQPSDPEDANSYLTHFLSFYGGSTQLWQSKIQFTKDGKFTIDDYISGGTGSQTVSTSTIDWVNLRFEGYEDGNGNFFVDIYVNGEKAMTSRNTKWTDTSVSDITQVNFDAHNNFDGNIYFDDLKVVKE